MRAVWRAVAVLIGVALVGKSSATSVWELNGASASAWAELGDAGFDVVKGSQWPGGRALVASAEETVEARSLLTNSSTAQFSKSNFSAEVPSGYLSLDRIHAELYTIAEANPDIAQVVDLSELFADGATTAEGRRILGLKISDNVKVDEDEPNVLIVAAHHCREIVTPEVALGAVRLLLQPDHRDDVDNFQTWVIPVLNVDGYTYVFDQEPLWRKNRRVLTSGDIGVDLNRNYPMGWDAGCGGSTTPSSQTYRGPSAGSEVEVDLIVRMSRDLRFERVMDFHSSGREVLAGYKCTPMPRELDDLIDKHATALAVAANYVVRLPSNEGEHQTDQIAYTTAFAYLAETATEFQPPHASALQEVARVMPLVSLFYSTRVPISGHVLDSVTGQPIEARIYRTTLEPKFSAGETRHSDARHGRFALWLPNGAWPLEFTADGYTRAQTTARIVDGETVDLEIRMTASVAVDQATAVTSE